MHDIGKQVLEVTRAMTHDAGMAALSEIMSRTVTPAPSGRIRGRGEP
jgi:hypothetical protein